MALAALFSLLSLACTLTFPGGEATPTPTAAPIQPTQIPLSAGPTATPPPIGGPPQIARLDSLASYRLRVVWKIQSADGSTSCDANTLEERVRGDQPAMHVVAVVPNLGQPGATITAETIYLGDTAWTRQTDGSWLPMQVQGWQQMGGDFWDVSEVQEWAAAGEETVGSVRCQHYTFRHEVPPAGDRTLPMQVEGELWVASQPDLPSVIVRQRVRWVGEGSPFPAAVGFAPGEILTTDMEAQLSDLNAPIVIEAPPTPTPTPVPATPTQPPPTQVPPPPTAIPSATPSPSPQEDRRPFVEQPPYTADCKQRPSGSVCLGFDDGYVWLIYDDSVAGWAYGDPWQGKQVQIARGFKADYHHVLGTNLVMVVAK